MLPHHVVTWLLTYLLHGTLLLGLAWLVSKPLSRWSVPAEEAVWKLALVGALLTASLQLAAGREPLAGRWGLADLTAPTVQEEAATAPEPPSAPSAVPVGPALALGAWAFGSALLLAGYAFSFARLGRRLKGRPRVVGGTLYSQLRRLAGEAGFAADVRLTCSSRVPVPLALGLRRPEICLPLKALAGLTDEQQEGMLAHELAHLARRDPLWLVISHGLACVFFFQPLNWVARRRLREISEVLSDEWAVRRTGRPLSLAGCLAEVAGWSAERRSLPVPSMADRPSHLARRIRRLLDGRPPESPARRACLGAAMVMLLIAVTAAAPAVSAAHSEASVQAGKPDVSAVRVVTPGVAVATRATAVTASMPSAPGVAEAHEHADVQLAELSDRQVLPHDEKGKLKQESERHNERIESTPDQQGQEESGKKKPPKMVLKIDLWGNIRLVPEGPPGC
jgi:beta-lactamase regulating signal transducer with metallopeptidase domain